MNRLVSSWINGISKVSPIEPTENRMNKQNERTNGRNMEASSARANEQTTYKDETKRMEEQRESAGKGSWSPFQELFTISLNFD